MDDNGGCIAAIVIAAFLLIIAALVGVTDPKNAARILESEGVTDVRFTGYDWFGCGSGDWYHTGFAGIKNGRMVNGVVCSGLMFKASTVRYH